MSDRTYGRTIALAIVFVCILVVALAGCSKQTSCPTPTHAPTATPTAHVTVFSVHVPVEPVEPHVTVPHAPAAPHDEDTTPGTTTHTPTWLWLWGGTHPSCRRP